MSGSEWAAVIGAQLCLVVLVVLVVAIVRLDRAAQDMRAATRAFEAESRQALAELRQAVRDADYELDRIDAIVAGAERVTERVDAASGLADRVITSPVVKAMAVGTGTRRVVQRLTGSVPERKAGSVPERNRLRARTESRLGEAAAPPEGGLMFKRVTWLTVGLRPRRRHHGRGGARGAQACRPLPAERARRPGVGRPGAVARPARRRRRHRT